MRVLLDLIRTHGSLVVLAAAFLENLGMPIPALAALILAGCLVVEGPTSLPGALAAGTFGALAADMAWFFLGRWQGRAALSYLCRLSLNPDSCVGRTERLFRSRSTVTILTSKLIPGLNTLVPPLAGILKMPLWRYALLDTMASFLWAGLGVGLGLAFGAGILSRLQSIQLALAWLLGSIVVLYVLIKLYQRHYLIKYYSVPKVDPSQLYEQILSGEPVMVVDLRSEDAFMRSDAGIPGARRIPPAEFDHHASLLPKDREIVLYCT